MRCGFRTGDRAPMAIIEFVGREGEVRPARPGTAKPAAGGGGQLFAKAAAAVARQAAAEAPAAKPELR